MSSFGAIFILSLSFLVASEILNGFLFLKANKRKTKIFLFFPPPPQIAIFAPFKILKIFIEEEDIFLIFFIYFFI